MPASLQQIAALYDDSGKPSPLLKICVEHFKEYFRGICTRLDAPAKLRSKSTSSTDHNGSMIIVEASFPVESGDEAVKKAVSLASRLLTPTMRKAGFTFEGVQAPSKLFPLNSVGAVCLEVSETAGQLNLRAGMAVLHPDSDSSSGKGSNPVDLNFQNKFFSLRIKNSLSPRVIADLMPEGLKGVFSMGAGKLQVKTNPRQGSIQLGWRVEAVPLDSSSQGVSFYKSYEVHSEDLGHGPYTVTSPSARSTFKEVEMKTLPQVADFLCSDLISSLSSWFHGVEYQNPVQPQAKEWRSHVSNLVTILRGMKFRLPGRGEFKFMRVTEHPPKMNLLATVVLPPVLSRPMVTDAALRKDVMVGVQQAMDKAAGRGILEITEWVPAKGVFLIGHAGG